MSVAVAEETTPEKPTINNFEDIEPGATAENQQLVLNEELNDKQNAWEEKEYHIENSQGIQNLTRLIRSVSVNKPELSNGTIGAKPVVKRSKSNSSESQRTEQNEYTSSCSTGFLESNEEVKDRKKLDLSLQDGVYENSRGGGSIESEDTPTASVNSDFSENHYPSLELRENAPSETDPEEEFINSAEWRQKPRHVFVLTEAGKPVYARHGSEDKLAPIMGVLLALVSCVYDRKDTIRYVVAGEHKFVFMPRPPLILVGICSTMESPHQVNVYLSYIYNTIISVLTLSQLTRIYETKKNFDLRRLLTGTDKFLNNMCLAMDHHPQFLLQAVQCLPISGATRDIIGQALQQSKADDLAFALLISHNQIVNICRLKEHSLHSADLHLILNLVSSSSTAFHTGESWTPICLPNFNPSGFLHAHISYLDESYSTCLLLLSADRDAFFTLSESKNKVLAKLNRHNCLQALCDARKAETYTVKNVGISSLRHFMYKSKSTCQFTCPSMGPPYESDSQRNRIYGLYQHTHGRIHDSAGALKLLYVVSDSETVLGWVTSGFELYAVFGPLVSKNSAISVVNRLLRWIKKQEDELFILRPPTF